MSNEAIERASQVSVSADGLHATLSIQANEGNASATAADLRAVLLDNGIDQERILESILAELEDRLRSEPDSDVEAVVAQGSAARPGTSGRFELNPDLIPPAPPSDGQDKAPRNYYLNSSIIVVRHGQKIGVLYRPAEPVDGVGVRGATIEAPDAAAIELEFDASVSVEDDGTVVSARDGCLRVTDAGVAVEARLEIDESVDFSTGNVDFPGDVIIRAGVRDRFGLRVGGDLDVAELVEAATLEVAGSAVLHRGMAGRGKGSLDIAGNLQAGYLDGVTLRVGHDLCVQRELSNCVSIVGRRVCSPECTVVSGELSFRFGGHVRTIGGGAETETIVRIGCDPELDAHTRLLEQALHESASQFEKARGDLANAAPDVAFQLEAEMARHKSRGPSIRLALERVLAAYERMAGVTLRVERSIMPGVILSIGTHAATVRQAIAGPVEVSQGKAGALMVRDPGSGTVSPLANKASMHAARDAVDLDDLRRWLEHPLLRRSGNAA